MWRIYVINQEKSYFIKGPTCTIGRQPASSLAFETDKSISRTHAEIALTHEGIVVVKDLGSKFGTFVEFDDGNQPQQLVANTPHTVKNGQIIRFGALQSRVIFYKERLLFCATRLEKQDKNRLKAAAKLLHAGIVSQSEECTHLVSNKFSATIKMLTAIAMNAKIINLDWFSFIETNNDPLIEIPSYDRFLPAGHEELNFNHIGAARSNLLKNYIIALFRPEDSQYIGVLTLIGAVVCKLFEPSGVEEYLTLLQAAQTQLSLSGDAASVYSQGSAGKPTLCQFYDECNATKPNVVEIAGITKSQLPALWLSAGQLASSIIANTEPTLSTDMPSQRSQGYSQSLRTLPFSTQPGNTLECSNDVVSRDAAAVIKMAVPGLVGSTIRPSYSNTFGHSAMSAAPPPPPMQSTNDVKLTMPASTITLSTSESNRKSEHSSKSVASKVVGAITDSHSSSASAAPTSNPMPLLPSKPLTLPATALPTTVSDIAISAPPVSTKFAASSSSSSTDKPQPGHSAREGPVGLRDAGSSRAGTVPSINPINPMNGYTTAPKAELPTASSALDASKHKPSTGPVVFDDEPVYSQKESSRSTNREPTSSNTTNKRSKRDQYSVSEIVSYDYRTATAPSADGWIAVLPINQRYYHRMTKALTGNSAGEPAAMDVHNEEDEEYLAENREPCETVERPLLRVPLSDYVNTEQSSTMQNKRFRKNAFRKPSKVEVISAAAMDRVFPKESEREIQLRLDFEASEKQDALAERLFVDR